jgi:hypothetical protein
VKTAVEMGALALMAVAGLFINGCKNSTADYEEEPSCWYVDARTGEDATDRGFKPDAAFASLNWALDQAQQSSSIKTIVLLTDTTADRESVGAQKLAIRGRLLDDEGANSVVQVRNSYDQILVVGQVGDAGAVIKGTEEKRGVFVEAGANVYFENVTITAGTAEEGGGVYVSDGGTLGLGIGVSVTANSGVTGSSVFVAEGGKLTLAGTAKVEEIFLHDGDTIGVYGQFTGSAKVTLDGPIAVGRKVLSGATGGYDNNALFTVSNDEGAWGIDAAGCIVVAETAEEEPEELEEPEDI